MWEYFIDLLGVGVCSCGCIMMRLYKDISRPAWPIEALSERWYNKHTHLKTITESFSYQKKFFFKIDRLLILEMCEFLRICFMLVKYFPVFRPHRFLFNYFSLSTYIKVFSNSFFGFSSQFFCTRNNRTQCSNNFCVFLCRLMSQSVSGKGWGSYFWNSIFGTVFFPGWLPRSKPLHGFQWRTK